MSQSPSENAREIQRYEPVALSDYALDCWAEVKPCEDGDLVKYEDHLKAIDSAVAGLKTQNHLLLVELSERVLGECERDELEAKIRQLESETQSLKSQNTQLRQRLNHLRINP